MNGMHWVEWCGHSTHLYLNPEKFFALHPSHVTPI